MSDKLSNLQTKTARLTDDVASLRVLCENVSLKKKVDDVTGLVEEIRDNLSGIFDFQDRIEAEITELRDVNVSMESRLQALEERGASMTTKKGSNRRKGRKGAQEGFAGTNNDVCGVEAGSDADDEDEDDGGANGRPRNNFLHVSLLKSFLSV